MPYHVFGDRDGALAVMIAWSRSPIARSGSGISAIFASTSRSPAALSFFARASAFSSLARSFIAARSSAVNPADVSWLAAVPLADFCAIPCFLLCKIWWRRPSCEPPPSTLFGCLVGHGAPPLVAQPAAVAHQLAVGQLVLLAPGLDAAREDTEPAIRRGQRTRVEAGARGEPVTLLPRQRVDLEDLDVALNHGHVAGVAQP